MLVDACDEPGVKGGAYFRFARFDAAMQANSPAMVGLPPRLKAACGNAPTAYLLPSLVTRGVELAWPYEKGATLMAFYGTRLANWLTLTLALWILLRLLPFVRSWALFLYSLPIVMLRGASVNQDAAMLSLLCLLAVALYRFRDWRRPALAGLAGVVLLVTAWKSLPLSLEAPSPSQGGLLVCAALLALASDGLGEGASLLRRAARPLWHHVTTCAALVLMAMAWRSTFALVRTVFYDHVRW
jgi:hypothetical protein